VRQIVSDVFRAMVNNGTVGANGLTSKMKEISMYLYCQKCATVARAQPSEIEQHTTWYHMHNNAWWPLQYMTTGDAMAALKHGVVVTDDNEPKYTQEKVDARRHTKAQQSGGPQALQPVTAQENTPTDCINWDEELAILLKEGK
jgi:hypothetical protein